MWYLKPYCEMGRSVINKLRYDRSGRLIDITDTKDPVLLVEKLGSDSSSSKKKGSSRASIGGELTQITLQSPYSLKVSIGD